MLQIVLSYIDFMSNFLSLETRILTENFVGKQKVLNLKEKLYRKSRSKLVRIFAGKDLKSDNKHSNGGICMPT